MKSTSAQLDLRLNSIKGRMIAAGAKVTGNEIAAAPVTGNVLDGQAKAFGNLIADALFHSGLTQKEASYRMGYADASKLARWITGQDVSQFMTRFLSLPELRTGLLLALAARSDSGVTVRTIVEIDRKVTA